MVSFFYSLFTSIIKISTFSPLFKKEVIKILVEIMFFHPRNFVDLLIVEFKSWNQIRHLSLRKQLVKNRQMV